ncbi:MAG: hypothetical protein LBB20_00835 [Puniceicoccales bacterium]|jgi:hypothetical protein|nr:hypothetical protein [Puniceicoccales bacterium]
MLKVVLLVSLISLGMPMDSIAKTTDTFGYATADHEQIELWKDYQYAGTLKKPKKFLFGFFGLFSPEAKYELVGSNGTRVAYVETSKAVLQSDISKFIDKKVVIGGKIRKKDNNRIIDAKYICLD